MRYGLISKKISSGPQYLLYVLGLLGQPLLAN